MNYLSDAYHKTLAENEKNISFWEDYIQNLQLLDFNVFADHLKVAALVPVGSKMLFRGELVHTNEITVSLGADYFAKCSVKQAEVLRQHRIYDAQTKLETFKKEREYIENRLSFTKTNIFQGDSQEIIEVHTEDEDKAWREKHKENVRQYKQKKEKNTSDDSEITDEELWMRLEELELQEELETEFNSQENKVAEKSAPKNEVTKRTESVTESFMALKYQENNRPEKKVKFKPEPIKETSCTPQINHKSDMLKIILEKQNALEGQLLELKNKQRRQTKSEGDLYSRLDEMEELEDLEDEMDRLHDILDNQDTESDSDDNASTKTHIVQRSVSFADQDDSETLELTFSHSNTNPCSEPYDRKLGMRKPSDIYEAHSDLFSETTSILKKSKYSNLPIETTPRKVAFQVDETVDDEENVPVNRTILVNDVVETVDRKKVELSSARPTSLFKKKRQQMKS